MPNLRRYAQVQKDSGPMLGDGTELVAIVLKWTVPGLARWFEEIGKGVGKSNIQ